MQSREQELEARCWELEKRVKRMEHDLNLLKNIIFTHVAPRPGVIIQQNINQNQQVRCQNQPVFTNRNSVATITADMVSATSKNGDINLRGPRPQQPCVSFNPFQMKSFIHPTTAVPPGNTDSSLFADLKQSNNLTTNALNSTTSYQTDHHLNRQILSNSQNKVTNSVQIDQPTSTSRWSAHVPTTENRPPNLNQAKPISKTVNELDQKDNLIDINLPYKRHARQSFVETAKTKQSYTTAKECLLKPAVLNLSNQRSLTNDQEKVDIYTFNNSEDRFKHVRLVMTNKPPSEPDVYDSAPFIYITFNHPGSKEPYTKHIKPVKQMNSIFSTGNGSEKIVQLHKQNEESDVNTSAKGPLPIVLKELSEKSPF